MQLILLLAIVNILPIGLRICVANQQQHQQLSCPFQCTCPADDTVQCTQLQLGQLPANIPTHIITLDLSRNNFTGIPAGGFTGYVHLEELNLSYNNISSFDDQAFEGLTKLRILNLRANNLSAVPWQALSFLDSLQELHLGFNRLHILSVNDFIRLSQLRSLFLEGNQLANVPVDALKSLDQLEILSLADNNISHVSAEAFFNLSSLEALSLANNNVKTIDTNAFNGLSSLDILELQHNNLIEIPTAIQQLPSLRKLSVAFNGIHRVLDGIFDHNPLLGHADLLGNPVYEVENKVFTNLTELKILIIPEAKELTVFPDLNGTSSLEFLRIDRARLTHVPDDLCHIAPNLKTLDFKSNSLTTIVNLFQCVELRQLQLSGNQIQSLEGKPFRNQGLLHDLLLSQNQIETIPADAFYGLEKLEILNLMGNRLTSIHPEAFLPMKRLVYLNVAENYFPHLPGKGLEQLRHLLTYGNAMLKDFPPPTSFPHVHTLRLSYAYHCCQFVSNSVDGRDVAASTSSLPADMQETVLWLPKEKVDLSLWVGNTSDLWPAYHNMTHKFGELAEDLWGSLSPDYVYPSNLPQVVEDYFEETKTHDYQQRVGQVITCTPLPGPFMPCEDLFDWWTLRCGIWVVFLLAMLGNGTVVLVLIFSRTKMDVPRFLVCNLACSDFCMGIYLGFLAVVDASTLGHFKMHALQWQFSAACRMAGFLGVLSSELSVITLAVITLERNYAITHAMHLNKRLSLKHAAYIMLVGWLFAIFTASLPLFGVSDYRKFAVCLPFDIEAPLSLAYVVFLMAVNGIAFLTLMGCYLKMYCAIRGSQAWNSNDSRIAKRMALLVFTDFICWAPIAFFSLTAAFGLQLISLEEAKVFTIFVLPLNSCANPFLYAILTKQFKKDCVLICKAIEESRVTRGIGRCRHSSNFSNRQTPANTNSAVDRHSNNVACSCSRGSNSDGGAIGPAGGMHVVSTTNVGLVISTNGQPHVSTLLQPSDRSRSRSWRLKFLFCGGDDNGTDSANEYAYAIAEIQKNQQKHSRNLSVSSDNFSSSRSDSWRQKGTAVKVIGDKSRRSSWTITRKASQDSNLSSSRNDSSATTPSTSTWRVSRSSVSSDSTQRSTLANLRERNSTNANVTSASSNQNNHPNNNTATPDQNMTNSAATTTTTMVRFNLQPKMNHEGNSPSMTTIGGLRATNVMPLTSGRPKARLKRQTAVTEDHSPSTTPRLHELSYAFERCPELHFTPRKLSTISSNSCSLNQESWSALNAVVNVPPSAQQPLIASSEPSTSTGVEATKSTDDDERCYSLTNVNLVNGDPRRVHSDDCFSHLNINSDVGCAKFDVKRQNSGNLCPKCNGRRSRMYHSDYVLNNWWKKASEAAIKDGGSFPSDDEEQHRLLDEKNVGTRIETIEEKRPRYLEHDV
ncbi:hypothetical protein CHUAL_003858 [Chamberlinius hualienensis]